MTVEYCYFDWDTGDDINGDGSKENPFKTRKKAEEEAKKRGDI